MKNRTTLLAEQMKEGKLGKGLKLKARLGDDFASVVVVAKAKRIKPKSQVVPSPAKRSVVESDEVVTTAVEHDADGSKLEG